MFRNLNSLQVGIENPLSGALILTEFLDLCVVSMKYKLSAPANYQFYISCHFHYSGRCYL